MTTRSASLTDALVGTLVTSRRRYMIARLLDVAAIVLPVAAALLILARWLSLPIGLVAIPIAAGLAVTWFRRPALWEIATRLDTRGEASDLLSTAMLLDPADAWAALVRAQAEARVSAIAAAVNWGRFPQPWRTSAYLSAAAIALLAMLVQPMPTASTSADAARSDLSSANRNELTPVAWVAPKSAQKMTDDPEEFSRPIPMEGNAPVKRPGDDGSGSGRADAAAVNHIERNGAADPQATSDHSPAEKAGGGNGMASQHAADQIANGGRVADGNRANSDARLEWPASGESAGNISAGEAIHPEYRAMMQAYFGQ